MTLYTSSIYKKRNNLIWLKLWFNKLNSNKYSHFYGYINQYSQPHIAQSTLSKHLFLTGWKVFLEPGRSKIIITTSWLTSIIRVIRTQNLLSDVDNQHIYFYMITDNDKVAPSLTGQSYLFPPSRTDLMYAGKWIWNKSFKQAITWLLTLLVFW